MDTADIDNLSLTARDRAVTHREFQEVGSPSEIPLPARSESSGARAIAMRSPTKEPPYTPQLNRRLSALFRMVLLQRPNLPWLRNMLPGQAAEKSASTILQSS